VHPRHPYAGELVFTAFSGSHQDAINKGLKALRQQNAPTWEVPYLPMDPADVGRSYEAVIRINSQSGKGGIAYVLETDYGVALPRRQQIEFSKVVQEISDREGTELPSKRIWDTFEGEYLALDRPFEFLSYRTFPDTEHAESRVIVAKMRKDGEPVDVEGAGSGPIDGFVHALQANFDIEIDVVDYREHAVGTGSGATAYAYVEIKTPQAPSIFGVGRHKNIVEASLRAIVSAVNRAARDGVLK
jgi:2-isopropylmalate synthase